MAEYNPVASGLAQLGGQVANIFQNMAIQNEYRNSLPIMQDAFRKSLADFDAGRSAAGYARIMDVAMQNPNNPFIQNMAQTAFKIGQAASDDYMARQRMMRTGGGGGGGGGGGLMGGGELTDEQMNEYLATGTITRGATAQGTAPTAIGAKPTGAPAAPAPATPQTTATAQGPVALTDEEPDEVEEGQFQLGEGQQFISTPEFGELGYSGIIIRAPFFKPVTQETEKAFVSTTGRKGRSKATETTKKEFNVTESEKDLENVSKIRANYSRIQSNPDLRAIFEESGKNFGNILIDESGDTGTKTYTAKVTNPQTGETMPDRDITDTEYETLRFFKEEAPNFFKTRGVIPVKRRQEAPAAPAAQPTATAPAAPEIPAEAAELQKIVEQGQAVGAGERTKATEKRIKDIDAEIKRLSSTTAGPQTRLQSEGAMPLRRKTPEQAQADIQKIANLKAEKDALQGKKPSVKKLSPMDQQALNWANANPNDPRSRAIKQKLGI